VPDLQSNPEMFAVLRQYASLGIQSILIFALVGLVLTMVIQSSAATFAITLIMCSKGWITFDLACALVLGSNIGTTITPIIASLSGNVAAKRASMGHLLFNLLGTLWCIIVFVPFANMNAWLTEAIGQGDPNALYNFVNNLESTNPELYNHLFDNSLPASHPVLAQIAAMQMSVSFGLSLFHTTFNLVNVAVMIWLTELYVKIVEYIVPTRHREDEEFTLKFISRGLLNASELNIAQAEKEMFVYAERIGRMINMAQTLIHTKEKSEEFNQLYSRLEKYEDISDRMELEIAHYLNRCAEGRLSNEGKLKIAAMLNIISEVESIADSCMGIGKILMRKIQSNTEFNEEIYNNIDSMYVYVKEAMAMMIKQLRDVENVGERSLIDSYNKEREINNMRNTLRGANVENINNHHYEYQAGIYYMDIVSDLERTGDYIINVVDTLRSSFRKHSA
jgi:phosphate:Na+ symporter